MPQGHTLAFSFKNLHFFENIGYGLIYIFLKLFKQDFIWNKGSIILLSKEGSIILVWLHLKTYIGGKHKKERNGSFTLLREATQ
jgi:hypothetical protein